MSGSICKRVFVLVLWGLALCEGRAPRLLQQASRSSGDLIARFETGNFVQVLVENLDDQAEEAEVVEIFERKNAFFVVFQVVEKESKNRFFVGFKTDSLEKPEGLESFTKSSSQDKVKTFLENKYPESQGDISETSQTNFPSPSFESTPSESLKVSSEGNLKQPEVPVANSTSAFSPGQIDGSTVTYPLDLGLNLTYSRTRSQLTPTAASTVTSPFSAQLPSLFSLKTVRLTSSVVAPVSVESIARRLGTYPPFVRTMLVQALPKSDAARFFSALSPAMKAEAASAASKLSPRGQADLYGDLPPEAQKTLLDALEPSELGLLFSLLPKDKIPAALRLMKPVLLGNFLNQMPGDEKDSFVDILHKQDGFSIVFELESDVWIPFVERLSPASQKLATLNMNANQRETFLAYKQKIAEKSKASEQRSGGDTPGSASSQLVIPPKTTKFSLKSIKISSNSLTQSANDSSISTPSNPTISSTSIPSVPNPSNPVPIPSNPVPIPPNPVPIPSNSVPIPSSSKTRFSLKEFRQISSSSTPQPLNSSIPQPLNSSPKPINPALFTYLLDKIYNGDVNALNRDLNKSNGRLLIQKYHHPSTAQQLNTSTPQQLYSSTAQP